MKNNYLYKIFFILLMLVLVRYGARALPASPREMISSTDMQFRQVGDAAPRRLHCAELNVSPSFVLIYFRCMCVFS